VVEEAEEEPAQLEQYLGAWQAEYRSKAITAGEPEENGVAAVNGTVYGRIVGRAPVSGMEED